MKQTLQLITEVQSQGENKTSLHEVREMLDKEIPLDDTTKGYDKVFGP